MAAVGERSLPGVKVQKPIGPHTGFVDGHYFADKKALQGWLDSNVKRFEKKARNSGDAETIRASLRMAEASAKFRHQLNPMKEEQMFDEPIDVWARLSEIVEELQPAAESEEAEPEPEE